jgi:hypothetical protein
LLDLDAKKLLLDFLWNGCDDYLDLIDVIVQNRDI